MSVRRPSDSPEVCSGEAYARVKGHPALWISSEASRGTPRGNQMKTAEHAEHAEQTRAGRLEFFDRLAGHLAVQATSSKVSARP